MAKFGIALGSGPRGLGFESRYSDHRKKPCDATRFKAFSFFIELKKYALKLQKRTKKRTTFQIGVDFTEMPEERAYSNGIYQRKQEGEQTGFFPLYCVSWTRRGR